MSVAEVDWSEPSHFTGGGEGGAGVVVPPFDYILAVRLSDCTVCGPFDLLLWLRVLLFATEQSSNTSWAHAILHTQADCIYHEHIVRHLYRALLALSNERTIILVANERRSESVQAAFVDLFSGSFTFKKVRCFVACK